MKSAQKTISTSINDIHDRIDLVKDTVISISSQVEELLSAKAQKPTSDPVAKSHDDDDSEMQSVLSDPSLSSDDSLMSSDDNSYSDAQKPKPPKKKKLSGHSALPIRESSDFKYS